jgi:hypothetical protein
LIETKARFVSGEYLQIYLSIIRNLRQVARSRYGKSVRLQLRDKYAATAFP